MIQKAQRTVDVSLRQYIDTTVDVPVAKQHEDCMTKHNEIEMDKKPRSAQFRTECKKQIVFDSEGDLRFGIRCKQGSRVVRCATLTTSAKTVVRRRSSRLFPGGPPEPLHRSGSTSAIVERNIDVPVPGACPRLNRRTDRRCACATVDSGRDRRSDEVGPT